MNLWIIDLGTVEIPIARLTVRVWRFVEETRAFVHDVVVSEEDFDYLFNDEASLASIAFIAPVFR